MAVTSLPSKSKNNLLGYCQKTFPSLVFKPGRSFYWSPKSTTVFFDTDSVNSEVGGWSLLHEIAHGQLNHQQYSSDFELLQFELEAWETAKKLSSELLSLDIDQDHIESCLDSYRDWLYARSTCPRCQLNGLQISSRQYNCLNCHNSWEVSSSRFCRPYKMQLNK